MAVYLLIGPSGSGKTKSSEIVAKRSKIEVLDLDAVLKEKTGISPSKYLPEIGDEAFFNISKTAIEEITAQSKTNTLIVIGAGSINLEAGHAWYIEQNLISFVGDHNVLYKRGERQGPHPIIDSFVKTEFSVPRVTLYKAAKHSVDVSDLTLEQIAGKLLAIIETAS
jgi:shikimate kinase